MICNFFIEPSYFFFVSDAPDLLYYSHIPSAIVALLIGIFVYLNARQLLLNRLLFILSICFSLWVIVSLISWTNIHSDFLLFTWTFYGILSSLISILSIYFVSVFLNKEDISFTQKTTLFILLLPVLIFASSNLSLSGFDVTNCDAFIYEGFLFKAYHTFLGILAMVWIFILVIKKYFVSDYIQKKQILFLGLGIELFLFAFFTAVFLGTYLTTLGLFSDSRLEFYGLFGMDIFMVFIAILIVRFKTFNVGLLASQALVVALVILVGSQFTFNFTTTSNVLTAVTLILTGVVGIILMRSVKREVKQREQLEVLTEQLSKANERLKILDKMKSEFVSIASHQLRSPLTSIRGYASMLAEGSYGKLPEKAAEAAANIAESSKYMALSIEDYLNVSRIEAGNMKYEWSDFNLKNEAEKIVDEMRPVAMKKGLVMVFRSGCDGSGMIHADIGKTRQVIMNLLDNSMKYTPSGTITVVAHDDVKTMKMYVTIQDTGVGMRKETLEEVFDKFVRAKNANQINVTGTGLGLFVAKKMVTEMKGRVWAESEGEGKGSTFTVEFPLLPGNASVK